MRILLASNARRDPDAGASRVHLCLADGLRGRGHEVVDLHLEDTGVAGTSRAQLTARRFALPRFVSRAAAAAGAAGFDVVMGSSGMTAPLFDRLRRAGTPRPLLVNHIHGLAVYDHVANIESHLLGLAPATLAYRAVTGPRQVAWDAHGVRSADLTVVQNLRDESYLRQRHPGVAVRLVAPCLAPTLERLSGRGAGAGTAAGERRVEPPQLLWFGTWEARKGAHLVPDAFRAVRAHHPGVRLVVGGTGRPAGEILAAFDAADRGAVEVLGFVRVEDQARILRRATVLLFPSLSEGFGLAPLEAAAFGCVPVLTATGFGADVVEDGVHGVVVPPTAQHVARGVCRLLDDRPALARMSRRAADAAARFSAAAMTGAYEDLFTASTRPPAAAGLLQRGVAG